MILKVNKKTFLNPGFRLYTREYISNRHPPESQPCHQGGSRGVGQGGGGRWLAEPPMVAHFVGADASGAKINVMQAIFTLYTLYCILYT